MKILYRGYKNSLFNLEMSWSLKVLLLRRIGEHTCTLTFDLTGRFILHLPVLGANRNAGL